jgi:hypothetical protein
VREPRATLWVFRLVQGEDCEGLPLDGNASQLVAENDAGQAAPAAELPTREAARAQPAEPPQPASPAPRAQTDQVAAGPDLTGVMGSANAAEATPRAENAEVAAATPRPGDDAASAEGRVERQAAPAAQPAQGQAPQRAAPSREKSPPAASAPPADQAERAVAAGPASDAVPTLTRPLPALSPSAPTESPGGAAQDRSTEKSVAAVEPTPATLARSQRAPAGEAAQGATAAAAQQSAAAQDPERQGKVEWGRDNVVITFATNSSYFPPGTSRRLASLLGNMAAGGSYRVQLEVGVSGSDTVVGATSPEEAKQYNRWLAERRMSRVREWLDENASDRKLEIEPAFQADDNSRRVVVRVAPVS